MGLFLIKNRNKLKMTQQDVADICSVSKQAVSKWERGESVPDISILMKLSTLYNCKVEDIINGEKQLEQKEHLDRNLPILNFIFSIMAFAIFFTSFDVIDVGGIIPDYAGNLLLNQLDEANIYISGFDILSYMDSGFIFQYTLSSFILVIGLFILSMIEILTKRKMIVLRLLFSSALLTSAFFYNMAVPTTLFVIYASITIAIAWVDSNENTILMIPVGIILFSLSTMYGVVLDSVSIVAYGIHFTGLLFILLTSYNNKLTIEILRVFIPFVSISIFIYLNSTWGFDVASLLVIFIGFILLYSNHLRYKKIT